MVKVMEPKVAGVRRPAHWSAPAKPAAVADECCDPVCGPDTCPPAEAQATTPQPVRVNVAVRAEKEPAA